MKALAPALLLAALPASAATVYTPAADTADAAVQENRTGNPATRSVIRATNSSVRLGRDATNVYSHPVFVFQLPELSPGEMTISAASFSFEVLSGNSTYAADADLWAISYRAQPTVLVGDFLAADTDATAGAIKIQDDIISAGDVPSGTYSIDSGGATNLVAFLQAQYDSGGAGNYIFIRLNNDVFNSTNRLDDVGMADNATESNRPALTFTAVPEPTTGVLGALSLLGLAVRRRRGEASHGRPHFAID